MKNIVILISILFYSGHRLGADQPTSKESTKTHKILWLGSSSANMMVKNFDAVINSHGEMKTKSVKSKDYFRLDSMSMNMKRKTKSMAAAITAIQKEKYDYVIIQISGGIVRKDVDLKQVGEMIDKLSAVIKKTGAKVVIFEHWSSEKTVGLMRRVATEAASRNKAIIAFCGSAAGKTGYAYLGGGGHVNEKGVYLWACCFYAALFKKSPVGLPSVRVKNKTLSAKDLLYIQKTAWETHKKYSDSKLKKKIAE